MSRVTLEDNPGGADETASGGDTNAVRAAARAGIIELIQGIRMADAQRRYREDPSDENFVRLQECRASVSESQRQSL